MSWNNLWSNIVNFNSIWIFLLWKRLSSGFLRRQQRFEKISIFKLTFWPSHNIWSSKETQSKNHVSMAFRFPIPIKIWNPAKHIKNENKKQSFIYWWFWLENHGDYSFFRFHVVCKISNFNVWTAEHLMHAYHALSLDKFKTILDRTKNIFSLMNFPKRFFQSKTIWMCPK